MVFAGEYPGDYGLGGAMKKTVNQLQLQAQNRKFAYRGAFVRSSSPDIERSLLYDVLSRKRVNAMFFLSGNLLAILDLVTRYPEQKFALPLISDIGTRSVPSNLKMTRIRLEQGAFLAGIIAAKMTRRNKIGMMIDMSERDSEAAAYAFVQGVRQINRESSIIVVRSEPNESTLENETTRMVSADDVDILFAMSGNYNDVIIRSAYYLGQDILLINSWYNAEQEWPGQVIASLMVSFDPIMDNFMKSSANSEDFNTLPPLRVYDLSDKDVLYLSWDGQDRTMFEAERPEYQVLSQETRKETTRWVKRIQNGEFVVFDMTKDGTPSAEMQSFRFRNSQNFSVID
ncbi:MAG: BMP family ABC transporter substrate-binding protein [Spirochaetota bacterium]